MCGKMLLAGLLATVVASSAEACINVDRSPAMNITWQSVDSVRLGPVLWGHPEVVTIGARPAILRLPLPKRGDDWQLPPAGPDVAVTWERRQVIDPDTAHPKSVRLLEVAFFGQKVGKTNVTLVFQPAKGRRQIAVLRFDVRPYPVTPERQPTIHQVSKANVPEELRIEPGDMVEVSLAPPTNLSGRWVALADSIQPVSVTSFDVSGRAGVQGSKLIFSPTLSSDGVIRLRFQPEQADDEPPAKFELQLRAMPQPAC